jgi:hypothetical protein
MSSWEIPDFPAALVIIGAYGEFDAILNRTVPRLQSFIDADMTYRLPNEGLTEILPSDKTCKDTQLVNNQTVGSPILKARANDVVHLMYQENGHVTKINQDPGHLSSGYIFVRGTLHSLPNDTMQTSLSLIMTIIWSCWVLSLLTTVNAIKTTTRR